ncbi:MAG: DnaJ domain-containing protein [Deltaproteobacteria bacterium]|nr:DnaJ domain-containing protein [Deltaproteobacteria bacterium]
MEVRGRIEETTVGDLVAQLHRRGATGTLVIESHLRQHRVQFRRGWLRSIRLDGHFSPLGEVLAAAGVISRNDLRRSLEAIAHGTELQGEALVRLGALRPEKLREALELQARERVAYLVGCSSGRYRFEAGALGSPGFLLDPLPLLRGSARRRGARGSAAPPSPGRYHLRGIGTVRLEAHEVLGVRQGATDDEVRRAFRRAALELHPDRHPGVDVVGRRRLEARFAEASAAYERLIRR